MNEFLVIYDANILIDFCKLDMLGTVFRLPYDFHTVDVVWNELREEQQKAYQHYIETGRLVVAQINAEEVMEIYAVRLKRPQLSFPDCTALVYARNHEGILLTSDKNLRSTARQNSVEVRGHLWIFDNLFHEELLSGFQLIEKLYELCEKVNPRLGLPWDECEARMNEWKE